MAPHILMGEAATARIVAITLFVAVAAALTLAAGVVWLLAKRNANR